jgi:hypothetical protein
MVAEIARQISTHSTGLLHLLVRAHIAHSEPVFATRLLCAARVLVNSKAARAGATDRRGILLLHEVVTTVMCVTSRARLATLLVARIANRCSATHCVTPVVAVFGQVRRVVADRRNVEILKPLSTC